MSRGLLLATLLLSIAVFSGCDKRKSHSPAANQTTRFTWRGPRKVFLAGEFNNWSPTATPMRRDGPDRWVADVALPPGKYQYKFVVDGQWLQDESNPETAPDGWDGLNSVMTVGGAAFSLANSTPTPASAEVSAPPWPRPETRWTSIDYPEIPTPGAAGHTITGSLRLEKGGDGRPDQLLFQLIFYQRAGEEIPPLLVHPETFVVRLHLGDGNVIDGKSVFQENWTGFGNQMGLTRGRVYEFPCGRNSYDEGWIEWRLPNQTFWFEVPYGFTRNPAEPWPPPDPTRSGPHLAAAMSDLSSRDELISWRFVEYDLGKIQNHWSLNARMANPARPGAEIILYQPPDQETKPWTAETPRIELQLKGSSQSFRIAFRRQDVFRRNDTFGVAGGGPDEARNAGTAIVRVDDRSYEFTIPSSLFKYLHGRADPENPHRLKVAPDLFELLLKSAE